MTESNELKLGSLFDGSGGFPLGGIINGIKPVWSSEIEKYPMSVTEKRMPWVKQLGDVTKIDGAKIEPVHIVTFGSPCQDLSVAGKRAGIFEGERSNLFFQAIRIIKEMRDENQRNRGADKFDGNIGRWAVWENVPGALSSNKGGTSDACCKPSATSAIKASPFLSLRKENGLTQEASWEMVSPWHGGSLIFNTSEHLRKPHLSAVDGYTLSAILEENVPEKYCLSAKACNGILRRARERGKTLPELLLNALKEVVGNGDGCES